MRSALLAPLSALLLLAASRAAAGQSTLNLNGTPTATLPPGGILSVAAKLPAGAPAVIAFDVSAGPTVIFGEVVPLGFTAATGALGAVSIVPQSGVLATTVAVPNNPAFLGQTIYLLGLAIDPSDPNGIRFTTGASLTFAVQSSAGADRAAFVGDAVVLDGSSNASSAGALAPGDSILWGLASKPAGSAATLSNASSLYPTFTPDLPGTYVAFAALVKNGIPLPADSTTITAFKISSFTLGDGEFHTESSFQLAGVVEPAASLAALWLNGANLPFASDGSFFVPLMTWNGADVTRPIEIAATSTGGAYAASRITLLHGPSISTSSPFPSATRMHITSNAFAITANVISAYMVAAAPAFNAEVAALPKQWLIGNASSATHVSADPTGGSYSFGSITYAMTPTGVEATTTLNNVKINLVVDGQVIIPTFTTSGFVSANVVFKHKLTFSTPPATPGKLVVTVTTLSTAISNFSANFSGIPSAVLTPVVNALSAVYDFIINGFVLDLLTPTLAGLADDFTVDLTDVDFLLGGKPYLLALAFTSATHTNTNVSAITSAALSFGGPPTGPALPSSLAGAGLLSTFGNTVPGSGAGFVDAGGITIDALNYLLARFTTAGFANEHLDALATSLGIGFGSAPFTAGELALLLPTAGFERLPASQTVRVRFAPTIAPVVRNKAFNATLALEFSGVRAEFVTTPAGATSEESLLTLAFDVHAQLAMGFGLGHLISNVATQIGNGRVLAGLPTLDLAAIEAGAPQFGAALAPLVAEALERVMIPTIPQIIGIPIVLVAIGPFGGASGLAAWLSN